MLMDSQAPTSSDMSTTRTMSRTLKHTQFYSSETEGRHVEQLLLRLDFNGVLTAWQEV